jgi:hypothetical protein
MVCIGLAVIGAAVGTAAFSPELFVERLEKIRAELPDAHKSMETESLVKWDGTFEVGKNGNPERVPVSILLYKGLKRVRIHVLGDDVPQDTADNVVDRLAEAMGITVIERSYPVATYGTDEPVEVEPSRRVSRAVVTAKQARRS